MLDILEKENLEVFLSARKISERRISDTQKSVAQFFQGKNPEQIKLETGTAIGGAIGIQGKAVILGADGQMTSGYQKVKGFDKIFEIDKYTVVGITGAVGFLQDIVKIFSAEVNFIQMYRSDGTFISPNGKANILSSLVKQVMILPLVYGIGLGFLLGLYDPKGDEARLFEIGTCGDIIETKSNIAADGCGRNWVYSVLEDNYQKFGGVNIKKKDLLKLMRRAIGSAMRNDTYCGPPSLFYLIDKNGVRRVR